jgi:hypothetical protein
MTARPTPSAIDDIDRPILWKLKEPKTIPAKRLSKAPPEGHFYCTAAPLLTFIRQFTKLFT